MWNDVANKGNNNSGEGKPEFVQFPSAGTIKLRVLDDEPISRWKHWMPMANAGKGLSITCIGKGCPVCAKISEAKKTKTKTPFGSTKSHMINVLTRSFTPQGGQPQAINKVQILDKGNKVFEGLLTIMQQMGDLKNYDVTITQTGEGFGNINYTILPTFPPVALTPEEASLPRYDISDISKALTVEQIEKLMAGATMEQILGTDAPSEPQTNESPAPSQSVQLGGQVSFN